MRPWIYRLARQHGLTGSVCNDPAGVSIEAFGEDETLDAFESALRLSPPPAALIAGFESTPITPRLLDRFVIDDSRGGHERRVSIPADLATCDECAAEIFDPANRRYRYPFTNCTNCGPRFTISTDIPYDRPATTMGRFVMCPDCQREYDDPADRRFHAQPNACPACGPALTALDSGGLPVPGVDPISFAAQHILAGQIVALKGLGGFHLACDATSDAAVALLRARKHRDERPFAVMVRDLPAARELVELTETARALLTSIERPIVLLPRIGAVSPLVAPRNPLLGVMLPYTPLHHLLLHACARPLVMTSANLSDEPIVHRNGDAVKRLPGIADVILIHDRDIVTRCDDSVAALVAGAPVLLRRSRGYVPRSISLSTRIDRPVLATGALLKNTFCLAYGREAWLGPHIGDLENAETFAAFEESIERLERFLGFHGEVVACDLHPDYLSTRYARARAGTDSIAVQHHHAHVASAVAEHGIEGPVLGLAFDGTGMGTDGAAWGGEFLLTDGPASTRRATFRPIALAGGDAAIRQPWRIAMALLTDAFGPDAPVDALALFSKVLPHDAAVVRQMLERKLNCPPAHGVGRYFDGFAALALGRPRAHYEGQLALELNMVSDPHESDPYDFAVHEDTLLEVDLRPAVRGAVSDLLDHRPASLISARFHNTLVAASAAVVDRLRSCARLPIVLTGGCFQNARLAEGITRALGSRRVHLHRRVPPGDGGIALGQALVAAWRSQ
jgi:hydrogenase maturation protein HypF